jgi:hypothetical protein
VTMREAVFPKLPLYAREPKSLTDSAWIFVTLSHPRPQRRSKSSPDSEGVLTQDLRPPIADGVRESYTAEDTAAVGFTPGPSAIAGAAFVPRGGVYRMFPESFQDVSKSRAVYRKFPGSFQFRGPRPCAKSAESW